MTTDGNRPIEACLIDLFRHLGIERAHIAAGAQGGGDWPGLATHFAERVATLSLVSPRPMPELGSLQCPLLVLAGDQGPQPRLPQTRPWRRFRARHRTGCVAMSTCSGPMSWPIAVRRSPHQCRTSLTTTCAPRRVAAGRRRRSGRHHLPGSWQWPAPRANAA